MSSLRPVALYGLNVPAGDEPVHAFEGTDFPATFRLTMAALDPTAEPVETGVPPRATLKMIRLPMDDDDEDDDSEDDEEDLDMADLLADEDSDEDEEANGGPSDPARSPKARKAAAIANLKKALAQSGPDEMDLDSASKKSKGKAKAPSKAAADDEEDEEEDSDEDDEDLDDMGAEEFVLCTLDPSQHYQQTLDIVINEHENVLFQVVGTHNIHLTGNIMLPEDEQQARLPDYDEDDEDEDYGYDEDELDMDDEDDEEDELDDLDDPRIQELASDEEEQDAPKLIKAAEVKKGKNKRAAEEEVDEALAATAKPAVNGTADKETEKLSKTQLKKMKKKMKDNDGNAVEVAAKQEPTKNGSKTTVEATKSSNGEKPEKKVAFAEKLVQGPSADSAKGKAEPTTKVVNGVTIEDKKKGSGPVAKNGDKVSMRYIGKLDKDKRMFDSNKKGPPFSFKLGSGQVIKGWDIGVAGMAVGGERRITIPAHLAYGSKGAPPDIPGNATLVFDLKVLDIKK